MISLCIRRKPDWVYYTNFCELHEYRINRTSFFVHEIVSLPCPDGFGKLVEDGFKEFTPSAAFDQPDSFSNYSNNKTTFVKCTFYDGHYLPRCYQDPHCICAGCFAWT